MDRTQKKIKTNEQNSENENASKQLKNQIRNVENNMTNIDKDNSISLLNKTNIDEKSFIENPNLNNLSFNKNKDEEIKGTRKLFLEEL